MRSVLVKTKLCRIFVQRRSGYRLRFYPTMINGAIFFSGPAFYSSEERFIQSLLRPGDVMVDAGCNIGLLSLAAKTVVGETGRCIAFEANPQLAHYAMGNSRLNNNAMEVVNVALGDENRLACLNSCMPDDEGYVQPRSTDSGYPVAQCRLADLLPGLEIRLLKIDVEGYELNVLKGAEEILGHCDYIYLEVCDAFLLRFGSSAIELKSFLDSRGFGMHLIQLGGDSSFGLTPVSSQHDFSRLAMYLAFRPCHANPIVSSQV